MSDLTVQPLSPASLVPGVGNASAGAARPASKPAGQKQPDPSASPVKAAKRVLVWDLPTRLFHWSLAVAVTVALVTVQIGGDWMTVHGWAGSTVLGLLVFRLTWGLWGHHTARFAAFTPTPSSIRDYLKGRWKGLGHNPLGALSVFAMLGLLLAQAVTGLGSNDDIAYAGPLAQQLSEDWVGRLTGLHHRLGNWVYVLIALHLTAIAGYAFIKRRNLVRPMVLGLAEHADDSADGIVLLTQVQSLLRLAVSLALAAGTLSWVWG